MFQNRFFTLAIAAGILFAAGCAGPRAYQQYPEPSRAQRMEPAPPPLIVPEPEEIKITSIPTGVYHEVRRGDTLYGISRRYSVSVTSIIKANRIRNRNRIEAGRRLYIPGYRLTGREVTHNGIPLFADTGKWKYIVVHHTATRHGSMSGINRVHKSRGWNEMGYHFLIDNGTIGHQVGQIEIGGRWLGQKDGAHAKDGNMNEMGIGISLVGNFSKTRKVPDPQISSLVYLINTLKAHYNIPKSKVIGHRDVPGAHTECPGKYFPWKRILALIDD